MKQGTINSNFVMQKTGAQEGLLTKDEMEQALKENSSLKAEAI